MNKRQQHNVALVAGASGIVGRQLVNTLLHHQWEVIGLSRHAGSHPDGIPMVKIDLLDAQDSAALRPWTVPPISFTAPGRTRRTGRHG
jgi:nucleoside-diphosphate-sugar epimerase